jgi:hypothetical protein
MRLKRLFIALLCLLPVRVWADSLTHELDLVLRPASGTLIATDRIGFAAARREFLFRLNRGLRVEAGQGVLERLDQDATAPLYRLRADRPFRQLVLRYRGRPVFSARRGLGGMPQGDLSADGVYLDETSAWYPLGDARIRGVRLDVRAPDGWQVLSVGRRSEQAGRQRWETQRPLQGLYLVAGRFHRHVRQHGDIELSVWLLQDDPALAARYLDLMGGYIDHYSRLIGPYPYAGFAVVENRWPTGLGMPSFTLLGGQVLRLPFIPYTSLPHEILHNWWGNGVWVDYGRGNWSEGLTAYLADHWMKERRGQGAQYRLRALQRYSNYAARGRDMPLLRFVSRHDEASQSVGYSKSLMFFHMLRRSLGDSAFEAGLRRLWRQYRYRRIGFEQALRAIVGGHPRILRRFLPWLSRAGAPGLRLQAVERRRTGDGAELEFTLVQETDQPFDLAIPVRVSLADGGSLRRVLHLAKRQRHYRIPLARMPRELVIDPDYDVLRRLDPSEQPPALSQLFGGETWLVIPTQAPVRERAAWRALAEAWQRRYPGLRIMTDADRYRFRGRLNLLVLGWDNRMLDEGLMARLSRGRYQLQRDGLTVARQRYPADHVAVVLVNTDAQGLSTGFIGAPSEAAITALARKLPHYGAYGALAFSGDAAQNRLKATPPNPHSRLRYRWD